VILHTNQATLNELILKDFNDKEELQGENNQENESHLN